MWWGTSSFILFLSLSFPKASFSLSDSSLSLHETQAADMKGVKGGLVWAKETNFSSFHFLSQGLILSQGEAVQGGISILLGCGPSWEVWPAANLTSLLSPGSDHVLFHLTVNLMLASSFLMDYEHLEVRDCVRLSLIPQGQMVPGCE